MKISIQAGIRLLKWHLIFLSILSMSLACNKDKDDDGAPLSPLAELENAEIPPPPGSGDSSAKEGEEKAAEEAVILAAVNGRALYAKNCESCHQPLDITDITGRKLDKVSQAISTVPEMQKLGELKTSELLAIVSVLERDQGKGQEKKQEKADESAESESEAESSENLNFVP